MSTSPPAPASSAVQDPFWTRREFVITLSLAALVLGMGLLTGGRYLQPENLRDILVNAAIPAVAAAGMTGLIVAAQIDISIAAIMAASAMVVALMAGRELHPLLMVGSAVGTGCALGGVNGVLTAYLRIPSIVATLATMSAIRGLLIFLTGGQEVTVAEGASRLGAAAWLGIPSVVWVSATVCAIVGLYLARTRAGRHHYAAGSNPDAAELTGIPVRWITLRAFVLLGGLVGLGGFLYACNYTPITPRPQPGFELGVITAVVVGGTDIFGGEGTVLGSAVAALLLSAIGVALTFLRSYLKEHFGFDLPGETQPAIQGMLILIAVLYNSLSRRNSER